MQSLLPTKQQRHTKSNLMYKMHVIYITGLGDDMPSLQKRAIKTWKMYGVEPIFFQSNWESKETFDKKIERLCKTINDSYLASSDKKVGLIAASAGVSIALHAYAQQTNKVAGVVSICGKIGRPEYVLDRIKRRSPTFARSMDMLPQTLSLLSSAERERVLCVVPFFDEVVATKDQVLEGALVRRSWSIEHAITIGYQLVFGAYKNCLFLRDLVKKT